MRTISQTSSFARKIFLYCSSLSRTTFKKFELHSIPNKYTFLTLIYLLGLTFFSYQVTHSYFTASATSSSNTFSAAEIFPTPTGIADRLVISEVQIDGGTGQDNDNDFIELYNPTSSSINLNGFRLVKRSGNSNNDNNIFTFTSSHIIPAHGFFLWGHQSGGQNPNTFATTIGADVFSSETLAASNSIAIRQGDLNTGTIIDALSWDPGASSLKEGTQFGSNPGANQSMERKALSTSTASSMSSGGADEFKGNGYDTDNNATDFILRTVSQPQNSSSPTETP